MSLKGNEKILRVCINFSKEHLLCKKSQVWGKISIHRVNNFKSQIWYSKISKIKIKINVHIKQNSLRNYHFKKKIS